MSDGLRLRRILLALLVSVPVPLSAQQTRIEAPGGVAAQSITNSPITIGLPPAEQLRMVEVFSQQIAVSSEARSRAEARAAELATQLGFTREAVIGFFRIVGEQDVPLEQVPTKLAEIATRHRALMDRWLVLDMADLATAALATEAKAAIDTGRYDEADAMLLRAREQEIAAAHQAEQLARDAQQAAERRWLRAAEADGKRGDIAMTRLRYTDAAQHYAAAAGNVPAAYGGERRRHLEREAEALFRQGAERGDNRAAATAVDRRRALAVAADRSADPLRWTAAQTELGIALVVLGVRGVATARLEEAVAVLRAASGGLTRERAPREWAAAQSGLGDALMILGMREMVPTARLEEAVAAYRDALGELTRERAPLDWGKTQTSLGGALMVLGTREAGTARLEEAVAALHAALGELTREGAPRERVMAQINLSSALMMLGTREAGTARLEEAVAALRAALEGLPRERAPLEWAMAQMNLGIALARFGEREAVPARLEEAVAAYGAALQEFTRERVPLEWAMTQMSLGNALAALGEREAGTVRLTEAVAAWDACLTVAAPVWPQEQVQSLRSRREAVLAEVARRRSVAAAPSDLGLLDVNPQPPSPAPPAPTGAR